MADIIDNREQYLAEHVCKILQQSESVKFAVGYFFVSGLQEILNHLHHIEKIRLLIGNQSNQETIDALMQREMHPQRAQSAIGKLQSPKEKKRITEETGKGIREALSVPPLTDETEGLLAEIKEWLTSDKLEVRVYTKEKLHAKAYLFAYPEKTYEHGIGIVGSSNLTLSGLKNNTELNVLVHGNDNFKQLNLWFDRLWEEGEPFNASLMQEIEQSWASPAYTPWDIYLKTLYKLVEDRLAYSDSHILHWDSKFPPLTQFQRVAVDQGLKILRDHEGVFISDVVGLGKTFIGLGMLKNLYRSGLKHQIIICPNSLEENWKEVTREYGIFPDILPMSKLSIENSPLEDAWTQGADIVLIDESHNFRNADSQRYEALENFLRGKKVILLTATPRNNSAWDIYHQLRLFQDDATPTLDIGAYDNLKKYFKKVDEFEKKSRDKELPQNLRDQATKSAGQMIEHLLQQVLIRRTRSHIKKHYADNLINGALIEFPSRKLSRLDYSIDETYNGLYSDILKKITELHYARYSIGLYLQDELKERQPYARLARAGRSLRGLMRILLLKRFESSVEAFRSTVRGMIRMHERFLAVLQEGYVVSDARLLDKLETEGGELDIEMLETEEASRYEIALFKVDDLETALHEDIRILREIHGMVKDIGVEQDDKLQTLLATMRNETLSQEKVIVFTQYSDTARYLHEQLGKGVSDLAVIDSKTKNKLQVLRRFSPKSNRHEIKNGENEIRVVIATDVFSEGLNLQDAACIINYDLHWNPVRLIQRVGRIDRIGSPHDTIHIYNFFPEVALDEGDKGLELKGLGLKERLARRIQEIHNTIGEDEKILDEREQLNPNDMYGIYSNDEQAMEEEGRGFDINEAEMLIRDLKEKEPELFKRVCNLPDGIRAGLASDVAGAFVFCGVGKRYKRMYLVDDKSRIIASDPAEIVPLLRCDRDTPGLPLPQMHNQTVEAARQLFAEHIERIYQSLSNPALEPEQQYTIEQLHKLRQDLFISESRKQLLEHLISAVSQQLPSYVVGALRKLKREKRSGDDLLDAVDNLVRHFELDKRLVEKQEYIHAHPAPKIYCSEALIKN